MTVFMYRVTRRQHAFIAEAKHLDTILEAIVRNSKRTIVDIKYGVLSLSENGIVVLVNVDLTAHEADVIRCNLSAKQVEFKIAM